MPSKGLKIIFRDELGRFLPYSARYEKDVKLIQVRRHGYYVDLAERPLPPQDLADLLSRPEFESLPEALKLVDTFESKSRYKAWDIAEQIDRARGIRRKTLKMTMTMRDGERLREVTFYHTLRRNAVSSYELFRRINNEVGFEGAYLYQRVGSKILADRRGRKVSLVNIKVEKVL